MATEKRRPDRFLIAIVAGIVLLVAAAVVVALLRGGPPDYKPDDTADAVAYNYLLALRLGDYERAYGYLSPTLTHYPANVDQFVQDVRSAGWSFGRSEQDVSLAIEKVIPGETQTIVQVRQTTYHQGGPFDSGEYSDTFDVILRDEASGWRIVNAGRYWYGCWGSTAEGCK
jgi:hypothetical protein